MRDRGTNRLLSTLVLDGTHIIKPLLRCLMQVANTVYDSVVSMSLLSIVELILEGHDDKEYVKGMTEAPFQGIRLRPHLVCP